MTTKYVNEPVTWRAFTDDSIESDLGIDREPVLDRRNGQLKLRIMNGVTPGGVPVGMGFLESIAKPSIINPIDGAIGVDPRSIFTSSDYNGSSQTNPNSHTFSQWQIATDVNFVGLVVDTGSSDTYLTYLDLQLINKSLEANVLHYVRVRYIGYAGAKSEWSDIVSFTPTRVLPSFLVQKVIPSDVSLGDNYTNWLSISKDGSTYIAGANNKTVNGITRAGVAYIYRKNNNTWGPTVETRLTLASPVADDSFGVAHALSSDGNIAFISQYRNGAGGSTGKIHVYTRSGTVWSYQTSILPAAPVNLNLFAYYLACNASGTMLAVTAHAADFDGINNSGAVYIFNNINNVWTETAIIKDSSPLNNGYFGVRIALSNNNTTLVVGAYLKTINGISKAGVVYIYDLVNGTWTLSSTLNPINPVTDTQFGVTVSISDDGQTVAVASYQGEESGVTKAGAAYVFVKTNGSWVLQQLLISPTPGVSEYYGMELSMSADGNVLAIPERYGSRGGAYRTGVVYIYARVDGIWYLRKTLYPEGITDNDFRFGNTTSLSSDGKELLVHAFGDGNGTTWIYR